MMNVDVRIPCHTDRRSFVKFRSLRAAHNLHSTVVHNSPSLHIWSHLVVPARWNLSSFSTLFSTSLYFLAWCSRRPCSLPSTTNQRLPPKQGFKYPRSLAVTFSKAKKILYPTIVLANSFSCFANQVHSFRIFSTSSIHHVEKQHRTSTSYFHKSNTKFR